MKFLVWNMMGALALMSMGCKQSSVSTQAAPSCGPALVRLTEVKVTNFGTPGESVENPVFKLTDAEAEKFLNGAEIVTARDIHDHYDVGQHAVSGMAKQRDRTMFWTIRVGGTGEIANQDRTEVYLIADPAQRDPQNLAH